MSIKPEKERIIKLWIIGVIEFFASLLLLAPTFNTHAWKLSCGESAFPCEMGAVLLPNSLLYWGYSLMLIISFVVIVLKNLKWAWFLNLTLLILFVPFTFIAANI
jgi:hypothetical protein